MDTKATAKRMIGADTGGLATSITGSQGGMSAEEEALQGILRALHGCAFPPVLFAGKRKYSELVEIISSQQAMLSRDQRRQLKKSAEKCGFFVLNTSAETIATRSGIAWNVNEVKYPIVRTSKLPDDEVLIQPASTLKGYRT